MTQYEMVQEAKRRGISLADLKAELEKPVEPEVEPDTDEDED